MSEKLLDLSGMWPDIFENMTDEQTWNVEQTLAAHWHEGWEPNREDTERLAAFVRGDIDEAEHRRLSGLPSTGTR